MSQLRYLVTGGLGFIGSNLVHLVLSQKRDVHLVVLDKLTYAGNPENLHSLRGDPRLELVQGDIADRELVRALLARLQPTAILNLAAESHVDRSIDAPAAFVHTNVVGTFEMLDAAREYWQTLQGGPRERFRFVHVSTDEVFGSLGKAGRFTESSRYAPNSPYAASKAAADHLARSYFHTYRLPVITTNCSNNYGPYQFPEKLIPLVTLNALERKPLPVYGDGSNVRDWLHVSDHCKGLCLVAESGVPGETYNLGGGEEKSTLDVVQAVCDVLDERVERASKSHRELITFVKDRPGHDFRYAIDASKIERELGWRPTRDFSSGLRDTVQWYLDNRAWCERISSGVYRRERLGLGSEATAERTDR